MVPLLLSQHRTFPALRGIMMISGKIAIIIKQYRIAFLKFDKVPNGEIMVELVYNQTEIMRFSSICMTVAYFF